MDLIAFAEKERSGHLWSAEDRRRIADECVKQGYYVIPCFFSQGNIRSMFVGAHGMPDPFEAKGYLHRHDFFELVYVYRGEFVNRMEDRTLRMEEGEFLLIPPHVLHAPMIESVDDIVFNLLFNVPFLKASLSYQHESDLMNRYFIDCLSGCIGRNAYLYFRHTSPETRMQADLVVHEYARKAPCFRQSAQAMMVALLLSLGREYQGNAPDSTARSLTGAEIISYIEEHCCDASLNSMAAQMSYSPAYLSRLISRMTGQSFSALLTQARLKEAKRMLKENYRVSDVAQALGFSSTATFSRFFQTHVGQSASEYRGSEA